MNTARSPFDLSDPPEDPPATCVNSVMWAIAREFFAEHEPIEGSCGSCGTSEVPCAGADLAIQGLQTACGVQTETEAFWAHYTQIKAEKSQL